VPFDLTVTAVDLFGQTAVGYTGTVTFTSSDGDPGVVLPADYTFTSADAGTVTFPGGVTLITEGDQTITATDTASGISGTATVTVTSSDTRSGGRFSAVVFALVTPVGIGPAGAPTGSETPWVLWRHESNASAKVPAIADGQTNPPRTPLASAAFERSVAVVQGPTGPLNAAVLDLLFQTFIDDK
jgi:hypothetical protein